MDTMSAFVIGEANRGKEPMVFDWEKAARRIKEVKPSIASAGLNSDWEYTGGKIYKDGKPISRDDTYVYLASTWATPELNMDGEVEDCYRMKGETPEWDADTYWPEEALVILNEKAG